VGGGVWGFSVFMPVGGLGVGGGGWWGCGVGGGVTFPPACFLSRSAVPSQDDFPEVCRMLFFILQVP